MLLVYFIDIEIDIDIDKHVQPINNYFCSHRSVSSTVQNGQFSFKTKKD